MKFYTKWKKIEHNKQGIIYVMLNVCKIFYIYG